MKRFLTLLATSSLFAMGSLYAAEMTMNGKISDSNCGATHKTVEHGGKAASDSACAKACIKNGAKYVFVSDAGKVYMIDNQTHAGLAKYAGDSVKLTGDVSGDSLKVSKLEKGT